MKQNNADSVFNKKNLTKLLFSKKIILIHVKCALENIAINDNTFPAHKTILTT